MQRFASPARHDTKQGAPHFEQRLLLLLGAVLLNDAVENAGVTTDDKHATFGGSVLETTEGLTVTAEWLPTFDLATELARCATKLSVVKNLLPLRAEYK